MFHTCISCISGVYSTYFPCLCCIFQVLTAYVLHTPGIVCTGVLFSCMAYYLVMSVYVCGFQVLPVPALEAGTLEKHAPSVGGLLKTLTALCAAGIAVFMAKL